MEGEARRTCRSVHNDHLNVSYDCAPGTCRVFPVTSLERPRRPNTALLQTVSLSDVRSGCRVVLLGTGTQITHSRTPDSGLSRGPYARLKQATVWSLWRETCEVNLHTKPLLLFPKMAAEGDNLRREGKNCVLTPRRNQVVGISPLRLILPMTTAYERRNLQRCSRP